MKVMRTVCLSCLTVLCLGNFALGEVQEGTTSGATSHLSRTSETSHTLPTAAVPAPRPQSKGDRFRIRHEQNLARVKSGEPIDLLFLGDSITDRWSSAPQVWSSAFGKWNAANFGVGGDRTQNVLWRIQNGEFEGLTPKVVVLMIGTNNTHSDSAEDIVTGIRRIIEVIHEKSPQTKVLLLAVFPREPRIRNGKPQTMPSVKVKQINKLLPALADGQKVRFVDIGKEFQVDGKVPKDIMPDGLHLNEKGYEIWAKAITPVLEEMMK